MAAADVSITGIHVEDPVDPGYQLVSRGSKEGRGDGVTASFVRELKLLLAAQAKAELRFVHGDEGDRFELGDESDGTLSWLDLLPVVLDALDEGAVVVVDEIDTSLHPLLTAQLVELFQDPETNSKNAQLIFTTHDTSLLGTMIGGKALDRDQIWFVQKNDTGATELYPLTDFKPRQDQNLERRYLGGSYGAVPVLDHQDFVKWYGNRAQLLPRLEKERRNPAVKVVVESKGVDPVTLVRFAAQKRDRTGCDLEPMLRVLAAPSFRTMRCSADLLRRCSESADQASAAIRQEFALLCGLRAWRRPCRFPARGPRHGQAAVRRGTGAGRASIRGDHRVR